MSGLAVAASTPAAQAAGCTGRIYYDRPYRGATNPDIPGLVKVVNTCERTAVRVKVDIYNGSDTTCRTLGGGGTTSWSYTAYHPSWGAHARSVLNC